MTSQPSVLVVGASGQLARALVAVAPRHGLGVDARGRPRLDVRNPAAAALALGERPWAAVVNAAAYTAVDQAETDREAAFALNRDGPAILAELCAGRGIPLIHVSTDYVFDGTSPGPYTEHDPVSPLSVYGRSKAEGEAAIRARHADHVILRTCWVFSQWGRNFVSTMLRLGRERPGLSIISDQVGRPTSADDLAEAIVRILSAVLDGRRDGFGTFHFACAGSTSWYGFAEEIFKQARQRGYPHRPQLTPIQATSFSAPAPRPANSVLDTARIEEIHGIRPRPWRDALTPVLGSLVGQILEQTV